MMQLNKYWVLTKRNAVGILAVLFLLAAALIIVATVTPYMYAMMDMAVNGSSAICGTDRTDGVACLTFDVYGEAPFIKDTLDILDSRGIKVTFFITGEWAKNNPDTVTTMKASGHEIMNSGYDGGAEGLSHSEALSMLRDTTESVRAVCGEYPTMFRPVSGDFDRNLLRALYDLNIKAIGWDVDGMDRRTVTADAVSKLVLAQIASGSIVRMGVSSRASLDALPEILDGLDQKGLNCINVSEMLYTDYILNPEGRQIGK